MAVAALANKAEVLAGEGAILSAATRPQEMMNKAAERETARLTAELEAANERVRVLAERADQLEGEIRQLRQHSERLENNLRGGCRHREARRRCELAS